MDFSSFRDSYTRDTKQETSRRHKSINLAPLKGAIESDPVRSRVLRVLIEDGTWVTTTDLLRAARRERPIIGAVTIGTILTGMNELVASRLVLSRTSPTSGIDWAEWRINPDWLEPTRKLLQMMTRPKFRPSTSKDFPQRDERLLEDPT